MKAVLRYLGGKNRVAEWIIQHFPAHTCYVEPYSGSLGVLLNKAPAPVEICKTISNMASPRVECLWMNYNPQLTLF